MKEKESFDLTVKVPIEKVNTENLMHLLEEKGDLIKTALNISALPVEIDGKTVSFPWFKDLMGLDDPTVYTKSVAEICKISLEA